MAALLAGLVVVALLPAVRVAAGQGAPDHAGTPPEQGDPLGVAGQGPPPADRSDVERPNAVEGELLVRFQPAAGANERAGVRARHGLEKVRDLPLEGLELVRTTRPGGPPEHAAEVARERSVRYAEPNHLWYPAGHEPVVPDDPELDRLWGLRNTGQTGGTSGADIEATRAWSVTSGSEEIVVGVIDTGTKVDHPDLAENIWLNTGELPVPQDAGGVGHATHDANGDGVVSISDYADDPRVLACSSGAPPVPSDLLCAFADGTDTDGNGYKDDIFGWDFLNDSNVVFDELDGDSHGTHVAGTIAAVTGNGIGVAGVSDARIMPLKFLGPSGGSTADGVKAVHYAMTMGADLTNSSWGGGGFNQSMRDVIEASNQAGMLFVAAAGNAGVDTDSTPFYPASYDNENIISVAATTHADALASFSNYGTTTVDMGAPGQSILSTVPRLAKAVLVGPETDETVAHRLAYHSFGLEGVSTTAARQALLSATLDWMGVGTSDPVLLVDDGGGATFQTTYQAALTALGYPDVDTFTVRTGGNPNSRHGPTAATMAGYAAVIWFTGATYEDTLTSTDQSNLTAFLNAGGNLALFGVDIGYDLTGNGSTTNAFYRDVLRTDFIAEHDGNFRPRAQPGTPYGSLPNLLLSGDQLWSDALAPRTGAVAGLRGAPTSWSSGTSMAAPHVAGAAAQVHAAYPGATHLEVRDRLIDRGDPTPSLAGTTVSGNRLNLAAALDTAGPPVLTGVSVTTSELDPGVESAIFGWTQNEPGHVTIEVTADGALSPALSLGLGPVAAGTHHWEWDGTISGGAQAAGLHGVTIVVGDVLGAHSQAGVPVTVTGGTPTVTPPSPPPPSSPPSSPSSPSGVSAVPGNQQAVVSWPAPSSTGGSAITGYKATASPGGRSCSTTGTRTCTITGLTNGTTYSVRVTATNGAGTSSPSAAGSVTPRTVPGAPRSVGGQAGDRSVTVSWTPPSSTGGAPITGYRVTASPGGQSCVTSGTRSCTVGGLTNGTRYTFTVRASNAAGTGPASGPSFPGWPTSPTQFADTPTSAFFYAPVHWLAQRGVTTGCTPSAFCPTDDVIRAQTATFIWRLSGSPAPSGLAFDDVPPDSYYASATRWMRAEGLSTGVGGTNSFEPLRATSRAEFVTLLWRLAGQPAQAADHGFADVPPGSYFESPVAWAKRHGITTGVGGTNLFEPHRTVTRAEAAAFLVRYATTPAAQGTKAVPIKV